MILSSSHIKVNYPQLGCLNRCEGKQKYSSFALPHAVAPTPVASRNMNGAHLSPVPKKLLPTSTVNAPLASPMIQIQEGHVCHSLFSVLST